MKTPDHVRIARLATAVIAVAIAWLSLKPQGQPEPSSFPLFVFLAELLLGDPQQTDKIKHALAYASLSAPAWIGFAATRGWIAVVGASLGYGLLFEGLQSLTPDRTASLADMVANSVGVAVGVGVGYVAASLAAGERM